MDLTGIAGEIVRFCELTLPFIFIGFLIANLIRASPYFDAVGTPMSYLTRAAHLPAGCSVAVSLYLFNSWAGLGMLSESYHAGALAEEEVLVAVLISYLPRSINSTVFFLGPVALSVFGLRIGSGVLVVEFLICLGIATTGVVVGRVLQRSSPDEAGRSHLHHAASRTPPGTWKGTITHCVGESVREFGRIALVLVPTGAATIVLVNTGGLELSTSLLAPFLGHLGLPGSSIAVFAASLASQVAAISATGTIAVKEGLTMIDCLLLYTLSRSLHLGIGTIRTGLPTGIALFGRSLGPKVTLADLSVVQGITAFVVAGLLLLGGR